MGQPRVSDPRGGAFQPAFQIGDFGGLHQAQMTVGQGDFTVARQPAEIAQVRRQTLGQQFGVARPRDPVGHYPSEG